MFVFKQTIQHSKNKNLAVIYRKVKKFKKF